MYYVEMIEYIAKAKRMESRVIDFEDNIEAKKKYHDSLACYAWPVLCAIGLYNMSEEGVLTLMHWSALDLHRNDPAKSYLDWKDNAAGRRYPDIGQMMLYSDKHNSYEYRSTLLRVCYDLVPGWKEVKELDDQIGRQKRSRGNEEIAAPAVGAAFTVNGLFELAAVGVLSYTQAQAPLELYKKKVGDQHVSN